ncbi:MAG: hypothetical protein WEE89_07645 [Gemmatimonadota bacterium]
MRADRRGFVLLEAVAALLIVSTAGIAVLAMVAAQLRVRAAAEELLVADALARERLLRFETMSRAELEPLADSLSRGVFLPPFTGYRWQTTVDRQADEPDLIDLEIVIDWDGGSHRVQARMYRPARKAGA